MRGRNWWSERELVDDKFWRFDVRYADHRGTGRATHRPDLAAQTAAGLVAIEVELRRKPPARLLGIMRMYADCIDGDVAPLAGVVYICDRADVADAVRRAAKAAWLDAAFLSFRTMDEVVGQARAAAAMSV